MDGTFWWLGMWTWIQRPESPPHSTYRESLSKSLSLQILGFLVFIMVLITGPALAGVAQQTEHGLRTKGSPVQFPSGHMPGLQGRYSVGGVQEATTH